MQETEKYKLKKPDAEDFFNIEDFNENTDKIEQALKENAENLDLKIADVNNNKINLYVGETLPEIRDRNKKTIYCKVTDTISASNTTENIKVSPLMGIKLV